MRNWVPRGRSDPRRGADREGNGAEGEKKVPRETEKGTDTPTVGDRLRKRYQREGVAVKVRKANWGRGRDNLKEKENSQRTARESGPRGAARLRVGPPKLGIPAPCAPREPGPARPPGQGSDSAGGTSPSELPFSPNSSFSPPGQAGPLGGRCEQWLGRPRPGPTSRVPNQIPHSPSLARRRRRAPRSPGPGLLFCVHFLTHRRVFLYAFLISICFCFASLSDFLRGSVCLVKKKKKNQRWTVLLFSKVLNMAFAWFLFLKAREICSYRLLFKTKSMRINLNFNCFL